jgi:hypothetical protein
MKCCFQCNGRFGLIRHTFGQKQFCSTQCLNRYKADIEQKISRSKVGTVSAPQTPSAPRIGAHNDIDHDQ